METMHLHTYEIESSPTRIKDLFKKVLFKLDYPLPRKIDEGHYLDIYLQQYSMGALLRPYFAMNITETGVPYSRDDSFSLFMNADTVKNVRPVLEELFTVIKNIPTDYAFIKIRIEPSQTHIYYRDKSTSLF
jgi:hypothetical protein